MVPSFAIAGATFTPGLCDPHGTDGGTAFTDGGQGSPVVKTPRHVSVACGAAGVIVAYVTRDAVPSGAIFTSHALKTSAVHGCAVSSCTAL